MEPAPETHFEVWGQAVYQIAAPPKMAQGRGGTVVLFAISDKQRQWLGWYTFNTDATPDAILLGATHEVLGEKSYRSSHFVSPKPMTLEELVGPTQYARGARDKGVNLDRGMRRAFAYPAQHGEADVLGMTLMIDKLDKNENIKVHVNLYIKAKSGGSLPAKMGMGWVTYVMSEPFKYPLPHLNVARRLRIFEHNLTS